MSLDIYLEDEKMTTEKCICPCCNNEHNKSYHKPYGHVNITHNLNIMAKALGIYFHLWSPHEVNITNASQMFEPLTDALDELESCPLNYKRYEPENGWGTVESFTNFLKNYLELCKSHPQAVIRIWS